MPLVDHLGHPIKTQELKREHAAPAITSIRSVWHGSSMTQGLTPDRLARILRGAQDGDHHDYLVLAEEMEERDPHYASVLGTRKRAVSGIEPTVDAASDDPRDMEIAEAVRQLVRTPEFSDLVFDLMDGLGKGYSVVEILWDQSGLQWTPKQYLWRDPRFFVFDRDTGQELRLLEEGASFEGNPLAPFKYLVHRPKLKSGLTLRAGLARLAAVTFMCKCYTVTDWMAFAEVFGMPIRVGRYGENASDEDISTLKIAVANIASDAAAVLPDSMRIEFVEAAKAAGGQVLFKELGEFLDRQLSKAVLGQTMTTDDGSSQSQATVHDKVRTDVTRDDGRQGAATINRDLIRPYVDLNYGPPKNGYPRVQLLVAEPEDVKALSDALGILVPLGLKVAATEVRDKLNLRDPGDDEEVLTHAAAPQLAPAENRFAPAWPTASNRSLPSEQDDMDRLAAEALGDWQPLLQPVLDPVMELAANSESYEEFQAGLVNLTAKMDSTELVERLAMTTFKARGHGTVDD